MITFGDATKARVPGIKAPAATATANIAGTVEGAGRFMLMSCCSILNLEQGMSDTAHPTAGVGDTHAP